MPYATRGPPPLANNFINIIVIIMVIDTGFKIWVTVLACSSMSSSSEKAELWESGWRWVFAPIINTTHADIRRLCKSYGGSVPSNVVFSFCRRACRRPLLLFLYVITFFHLFLLLLVLLLVLRRFDRCLVARVIKRHYLNGIFALLLRQ